MFYDCELSRKKLHLGINDFFSSTAIWRNYGHCGSSQRTMNVSCPGIL